MLRTESAAFGAEKICNKCSKFSPIDDFPKSNQCIGGRAGTCRKCKYEMYRRIHPAHQAARTLQRKTDFLQVLRNSRNVRAACKASGLDNSTFHRWKRSDDGFAAMVKEAREIGIASKQRAAQAELEFDLSNSLEKRSCKRCGILKPLSPKYFRTFPSGNGSGGVCRACDNQRHKEKDKCVALGIQERRNKDEIKKARAETMARHTANRVYWAWMNHVQRLFRAENREIERKEACLKAYRRYQANFAYRSDRCQKAREHYRTHRTESISRVCSYKRRHPDKVEGQRLRAEERAWDCETRLPVIVERFEKVWASEIQRIWLENADRRFRAAPKEIECPWCKKQVTKPQFFSDCLSHYEREEREKQYWIKAKQNVKLLHRLLRRPDLLQALRSQRTG